MVCCYCLQLILFCEMICLYGPQGELIMSCCFNSRYPLYLVPETHTPSLIFQGWTDEAAALVCQQLGLIYSPDQGASSLRVNAPPDMRVLMSWVSCDEVDDDLTRCRALQPPDINCAHDRDVYLRCQDPTWAGEVWAVFVIVISVLMF